MFRILNIIHILRDFEQHVIISPHVWKKYGQQPPVFKDLGQKVIVSSSVWKKDGQKPSVF